jgi:hypothetical protein
LKLAPYWEPFWVAPVEVTYAMASNRPR